MQIYTCEFFNVILTLYFSCFVSNILKVVKIEPQFISISTFHHTNYIMSIIN